jgi:hypothetical protein
MGKQIRAGRALLGWTRSELAQAAGLHRNSVAYWEDTDSITATGFHVPYACRLIDQAFEAAGIEAFCDPAPGVRFCSEQRKPRRKPRALRNSALGRIAA